MLITTDPPFTFYYAISNDGLSWNKINESKFPCCIPDEAQSSRDIELHYNDNEFTIVFSTGGSIYFGQSDNGTNWSGLDTTIIDGEYSNPSFVNDNNFQMIWTVKEDKIYLLKKSSQSSDWSLTNDPIKDHVYNCKVLNDGKTYYMWYTDAILDHIYLMYSTDSLFKIDCTQSTVYTIDGFHTIYNSSIIFDYNRYQYVLYIIASSSPNKLYKSICSSFDSN